MVKAMLMPRPARQAEVQESSRRATRRPWRTTRAVSGRNPSLASTAAIVAPGQLASHYAPRKPVRLDARDRRAGEYWIGFGPIAGDATLSAGGDLVEAAARLFDLLHRADAASGGAIAVAPVPAIGMGAAINDRLRRAAAR